MKKLLSIISICITACILLSSCGSNMSIAKRHYNKGYYIEYAKRVQTINPRKEEAKVIQPQKIQLSKSNQYSAKQIIVSEHPNQNGRPSNPIIIEDKKRGNHVSKISPNSVVITKNATSSEAPVLQTTQALSDISGYHGDGGGERAALSLLWIVIIIILVLWLIGILAGGFGLGGLINVLLVIALILLILWLLRIW